MSNDPPINEGPVIVPDDGEEPDDSSSDRAVSIASSSTSLASSIMEHRIENGRTYHKYKDGKYVFPNDERENDRLDVQHELFLLTAGYQLGLAPPAKQNSGVKRVLDVGTGTGLWAVEFGDDHPEAEILGVDLSPVQTTFVPPNVKFEVDDIDEPWMYSQPFDYIHCRTMSSSIPNWTKFFQQCFDNLEPGGWLELQDGHIRPECDDGTMKPGNQVIEWVDLLEKACKTFGRPFVDCPTLVPIMENVGFVDVTLTKYKWPLNDWPKDKHYKELGIWAHEILAQGLEALTMGPFTRALEWTPDEVQVLLAGLRKALKDRTTHAYLPMYFIQGRKPTEESG